jgi:hypothetical protein
VPVHRKAAKALLMFSSVVVFSVLLTFGLTPAFITFNSGSFVGYGEAMMEGISAGTFLAKVSGKTKECILNFERCFQKMYF